MKTRFGSMLVLALLAVLTVSAQTRPIRSTPRDSVMTPAGVCHLWQLPPNAPRFPADASYNLCALNERPVLVTQPVLPGPPPGNLGISASFAVVVDASGRVNAALTHLKTGGPERAFLAAVHDSLSQWRFTPGKRHGQAVRSAFVIWLRASPVGMDTLPSTLEWRYYRNPVEDTLVVPEGSGQRCCRHSSRNRAIACTWRC